MEEFEEKLLQDLHQFLLSMKEVVKRLPLFTALFKVLQSR